MSTHGTEPAAHGDDHGSPKGKTSIMNIIFVLVIIAILLAGILGSLSYYGVTSDGENGTTHIKVINVARDMVRDNVNSEPYTLPRKGYIFELPKYCTFASIGEVNISAGDSSKVFNGNAFKVEYHNNPFKGFDAIYVVPTDTTKETVFIFTKNPKN